MTPDDVELVLAEYAGKFPALITLPQAAEIAQVPLATIYAWSGGSEGLLDGFKIRPGRHVLLGRDAFVRYLLAGPATAAV